MNFFPRVLPRWIPVVVVMVGLVTAGWSYRQQMFDQITPILQSYRSKSVGDARVVSSPQAIGPFRLSAAWELGNSHTGENRLTLQVHDESGASVEGAWVRIVLDNPITAEEQAPGVYTTDVNIAKDGDGEIAGEVRAVDLRHSDFKIAYVTGEPKAAVEPSTGVADQHNPSEIAYWTCSMHPSVRSATPGKCPICAMDLISVTHGELKSGIIRVDSLRRQLIGVTTGLVERRELSLKLQAVGTVAPDETRLHDVTLRHQAWIGTVFADFTGKAVRKGEPMFTYYSPDFRVTQEEYLEALRRAKDEPERGARMVQAAEARLKLWQIDDTQLRAIREAGRALEYLTFNAPASGTVIEKTIVGGSASEAGMRLYRIADLSTVWIDASFFVSAAGDLAVGQETTVTFAVRPNAPVRGTISYLYPEMNAETRTVRARIEVANPDGALKPGMYAEVVAARPLGERLVVPEGAVIFAGRTRLAFADLGEGRLQPRRITTGAQSAGYIEVLDGLKEGETVVTSANFLIAAESRLKSGIEKW